MSEENHRIEGGSALVTQIDVTLYVLHFI